MKIVVVGDGKVGFAIAKQLNQEGHDITVVENKVNVLSSTMNQLDIVGVQGNGASLDTLLEARVPSSDLLIAATSTDEVNIIFKNFVVITATITPANTDSVVLHPKLIIMINTAIIAKNETTANRVVGCFLSLFISNFLLFHL